MAKVTPPVEAAAGSIESVKEVLRVAVLQVELSKSVTGDGKRAKLVTPVRSGLVKRRPWVTLAEPAKTNGWRKILSGVKQKEMGVTPMGGGRGGGRGTEARKKTNR